MVKNILIAVLIAVVLGAGGWYYFTQVDSTQISRILDNPRDFDNRTVTISGQVKDRISLLIIKYFIVQDGTGEIVVITNRAMPAVGTKVRVKGTIKEAYSLGDEQMIVLVEETNEKETE